MFPPRLPVKTSLKTAGTISPYLAVILGVFFLKSGWFAVLLYHSTLLVCVIGINGFNTLRLIKSGYNRCLGPLIGLCGLVPGVVILFIWPFAKQQTVDLKQLMNMLSLSNNSFAVFALYCCLVNPILEELFWRGCFKHDSWHPGLSDALFAGYHAVILMPVINSMFAVLSFLALMFVGWSFRNIYRLTGGLAIPLLAHLIADIAILYSVWKLIQ